jgi:hypothetical protein
VEPVTRRSIAGALLATAFLWTIAGASLLFIPRGLLASYDLPSHWHMALLAGQDPLALWDDAWYAGHPTYGYPPLAHRVAGILMTHLSPDVGFKLVVALAYVLSPAAVYAAARTAAGLTPPAAAAATLLTALSPALLRALLFGQYPTLVAFLIFWLTVAACFSLLRSDHFDVGLAIVAALLVAVLGSVHLYPVLLLPLALAPMLLGFPARRALTRVAPPLAAGAALGLLPSLAFVLDIGAFSKAPVMHLTRTAAMIQPAGLAEWILFPAGLPIVLGLIVLLPAVARRWRLLWAGAGIAGAALWYVRHELAPIALALCLTYVALFVWAVRRAPIETLRPSTRGLAAAGVVMLWLSLGPAGGLARLLPFRDTLIYDRPLAFGAPLGCFALMRVLWPVLRSPGWLRRAGIALTAAGLILLGISTQRVVTDYTELAPGAQGGFPRGTEIPADILRALSDPGATGRVLPLGMPPVAHLIPDLTGRPSIDGGYNDARQLGALRASGLETLGYEKAIHSDLRFNRFFLRQAEQFGIEWVLTGDRDYDAAVPADRFRLVLESGADPDRSVRLYRSVIAMPPAWDDLRPAVASEVGVILPEQMNQTAVGGGVNRAHRYVTRDMTGVFLYGTMKRGWVLYDVDLGLTPGCNQMVFRAWSPTGAALLIRKWQQERWVAVMPERTLTPAPETIRLALDCARDRRLQFGFLGAGFNHAYLSRASLLHVRGASHPVPFKRLSRECVRVAILDESRPVTVSVPYSQRWRVRGPAVNLNTAPSELGLLTVRGPAGRHDLCLAFPDGVRWARSVLPTIYAGLVGLVLVPRLWARVTRRSARSPITRDASQAAGRR